jgi:hypothetical protein
LLFTTVLLAVRNQRILAAWDARQEDNARRGGGRSWEPRSVRDRPV